MDDSYEADGFESQSPCTSPKGSPSSVLASRNVQQQPNLQIAGPYAAQWRDYYAQQAQGQAQAQARAREVHEAHEQKQLEDQARELNEVREVADLLRRQQLRPQHRPGSLGGRRQYVESVGGWPVPGLGRSAVATQQEQRQHPGASPAAPMGCSRQQSAAASPADAVPAGTSGGENQERDSKVAKPGSRPESTTSAPPKRHAQGTGSGRAGRAASPTRRSAPPGNKSTLWWSQRGVDSSGLDASFRDEFARLVRHLGTVGRARDRDDWVGSASGRPAAGFGVCTPDAGTLVGLQIQHALGEAVGEVMRDPSIVDMLRRATLQNLQRKFEEDDARRARRANGAVRKSQ